MIKNINKVIGRNTITNLLITLVIVMAVILIAATSVPGAAAFEFNNRDNVYADECLCYEYPTIETRNACYHGLAPGEEWGDTVKKCEIS